MAGLVDTIANTIRNSTLSAEEKRARAAGRQTIELIKLASVVSVVVTFLFFAIFPNVLTFSLVALAGYSAFEVWNVMNNFKEIHNSATIEVIARWNQQNLINHLTKNAPLFRSITEILNPDLSPLLL